MYDYHLHSHFSGDCSEQMEETIKEAIRKGGKQLCFTDHLDYDYPTTEIQFEFDPHGFSQAFEILKEKYKDQILLQKGIEMGLQTHIVEECLSFNQTFKPEFVLCSFHVADKKDMYNGDYYRDKTPEQAWDVYFDEMLETLEAFKDYSVVGHLDIPKRYDASVKAVPFSYYKEKVVQVLKRIIGDERGIEVNMSGLRSDLKETLPSREIIELYHELGGKIITIGSDAHNRNEIYSHFYETLGVLDDIGFESFTIYNKRIPEQVSIKRTLADR
ncbi:histidinol-phosphatase HisJ family protein [Acidaminobacter sp. JC074]|uniref:histidinol-phosphatase HisJ family protein n=1 Tax=Acidaminobacter sp. JC074 TaxID=2530199 RepID=UPI001F10E329|nr:histidinol-phosphatase HisJ family protein [Acidaminobacter sp. JC074]MCH4890764.1 histidinol-phosphatase HisJ family protein [Acidaminobacter sp. JC074]